MNKDMSAGKREAGAEHGRPGFRLRTWRVPLFLAGFLLLVGAFALLLYGAGLLRPSAETDSVLKRVAPLTVGTPQVLDAAPAAGAGDPAIGSSAPSFTLRDLDGNWASLADYEGQPLLINFWATWCGPCIVEMPELQSAYEAHQEEGLVVLGLNRDEDTGQIRGFFANSLDTEITFPILLDEHAAVADRYQVFNLPTTFVVDGNGVITAIHRGPLSQAQIEAYLADM